MVTRYAVSFGAAGPITLGLLLLMSQLILTGRPPLVERARVQWVPFVVERTAPPPVETRERIERTPLELRPPVPSTPNGTTGTSPIAISNPLPPTIGPAQGNNRLAPIDGDLLPIVKVQPNYPPTALARGLEGHVIVAFDVTRTGSVESVTIVESTHPIFERAAVEAATRFRYRPRVVAGEAVRVTGVQNVIRFTLRD